MIKKKKLNISSLYKMLWVFFLNKIIKMNVCLYFDEKCFHRSSIEDFNFS